MLFHALEKRILIKRHRGGRCDRHGDGQQSRVNGVWQLHPCPCPYMADQSLPIVHCMKLATRFVLFGGS